MLESRLFECFIWSFAHSCALYKQLRVQILASVWPLLQQRCQRLSRFSLDLPQRSTFALELRAIMSYNELTAHLGREGRNEHTNKNSMERIFQKVPENIVWENDSAWNAKTSIFPPHYYHPHSPPCCRLVCTVPYSRKSSDIARVIEADERKQNRKCPVFLTKNYVRIDRLRNIVVLLLSLLFLSVKILFQSWSSAGRTKGCYAYCPQSSWFRFSTRVSTAWVSTRR